MGEGPCVTWAGRDSQREMGQGQVPWAMRAHPGSPLTPAEMRSSKKCSTRLLGRGRTCHPDVTVLMIVHGSSYRRYGMCTWPRPPLCLPGQQVPFPPEVNRTRLPCPEPRVPTRSSSYHVREVPPPPHRDQALCRTLSHQLAQM